MEIENQPFISQSVSMFLTGKQAEIKWIVQDILPSEGVAILSGPPNMFKSWTLQDMGIACSTPSGKWLGKFATRVGTVLYIDEESSKELLKVRLNKLLNGTGINRDSLNLHLMVGQGLNLNNHNSVARLWKLMDSLRPNLVIADSLIRLHQSDENSAKEMARVFGVVKDLVREFKCCFVFADHQRKPSRFNGSLDNMLRGSSEKVAFVDTLLSIKKSKNSLIVEHSKSRFVKPVPSFLVEVRDEGVDTTRVVYMGVVGNQKQEEQLKKVGEFLKLALTKDEWISRKKLVELSKLKGMPVKKLDNGLKHFFAEGVIDYEGKTVPSGRKQDFYRLHVDNEKNQCQVKG